MMDRIHIDYRRHALWLALAGSLTLTGCIDSGGGSSDNDEEQPTEQTPPEEEFEDDAPDDGSSDDDQANEPPTQSQDLVSYSDSVEFDDYEPQENFNVSLRQIATARDEPVGALAWLIEQRDGDTGERTHTLQIARFDHQGESLSIETLGRIDDVEDTLKNNPAVKLNVTHEGRIQAVYATGSESSNGLQWNSVTYDETGKMIHNGAFDTDDFLQSMKVAFNDYGDAVASRQNIVGDEGDVTGDPATMYFYYLDGEDWDEGWTQPLVVSTDAQGLQLDADIDGNIAGQSGFVFDEGSATVIFAAQYNDVPDEYELFRIERNSSGDWLPATHISPNISFGGESDWDNPLVHGQVFTQFAQDGTHAVITKQSAENDVSATECEYRVMMATPTTNLAESKTISQCLFSQHPNSIETTFFDNEQRLAFLPLYNKDGRGQHLYHEMNLTTGQWLTHEFDSEPHERANLALQDGELYMIEKAVFEREYTQDPFQPGMQEVAGVTFTQRLGEGEFTDSDDGFESDMEFQERALSMFTFYEHAGNLGSDQFFVLESLLDDVIRINTYQR